MEFQLKEKMLRFVRISYLKNEFFYQSNRSMKSYDSNKDCQWGGDFKFKTIIQLFSASSLIGESLQ